jgi:type IV pilus assembly protein PilB
MNNLAMRSLLEMTMNRKNLGDLLLEYKLITQDDLDEALRLQSKGEKKRIGEILVELGKVAEDDIQYLISKQLNIPFIFLRDITLDDDLIKKFPKDFLINNRIIPLYETNNEISVATNDPFNFEAINKFKEITGKDVNVSACSSKDILEKLQHIKYFYLGQLVESLDSLIKNLKKSGFYRIDFIFDKTLKINISGSFAFQKIYDLNIGQIAPEEILKYFQKFEYGYFYELFTNTNSFILFIYPILELSNIVFINKFGIFPDKMPLFTDLNYWGKLNIFKSELPKVGYNFIPFKQFMQGENIINLIDNVSGSLPEGVMLPVLCESCKGAKCENCNHLGYSFEVKHG